MNETARLQSLILEQARVSKLPRVTRSCASCGGTFTTPYVEKRYCSRECKGRATLAREYRRKYGGPRTCRKCGGLYTYHRHNATGAGFKYCSFACWPPYHHRGDKPRKPAQCRECGAMFVPNRGSRLFCGPRCREVSRDRAIRAAAERRIKRYAIDPAERRRARRAAARWKVENPEKFAQQRQRYNERRRMDRLILSAAKELIRAGQMMEPANGSSDTR